jgi:protein-disulfide isomerase
MPRLIAAAALTALSMGLALGAMPATSQTAAPSEMTPDARAAFRAEIRAYLLENPEVIFEAVAEYERRATAAQADMDVALVEINAEDIFEDGHSWEGGNPDGDVVLVEFMDYRCSFCRRAFPEMMDFVAADGNVRLIIKELPILGPASEIMSRFAIATHLLEGNDAYFMVHEALLDMTGEPTDEALGGIAADLGLQIAPLLEAMRGADVTTILTENRRLAQRLQISGTPSFVMGDGTRGQMLRGMVPAEGLRRAAAELRG